MILTLKSKDSLNGSLLKNQLSFKIPHHYIANFGSKKFNLILKRIYYDQIANDNMVDLVISSNIFNRKITCLTYKMKHETSNVVKNGSFQDFQIPANTFIGYQPNNLTGIPSWKYASVLPYTILNGGYNAAWQVSPFHQNQMIIMQGANRRTLEQDISINDGLYRFSIWCKMRVNSVVSYNISVFIDDNQTDIYRQIVPLNSNILTWYNYTFDLVIDDDKDINLKVVVNDVNPGGADNSMFIDNIMIYEKNNEILNVDNASPIYVEFTNNEDLILNLDFKNTFNNNFAMVNDQIFDFILTPI